jgi:Protein of unknown function (DUF3098)
MAKSKTTTSSTPASKPSSAPLKHTASTDDLAFVKQNYVLMIIGVVFIIVGYMLMAGGKSTDPNVFNGEEIFSFRRITLAPIVVLIGYAIEVYAIVKKAD